MFGHDDKQDESQQNEPALEVPMPDQIGDDQQPAVSSDTDWQQPSEPETATEESKSIDVVSPAGGFPRSTDTQASSHPAPSAPTPPSDDTLVDTDSTVNDLIEIRQNALTELAPLLDQLDLNPEERFRTLMLVIQSSDDQKLIKEAYDAAHGITDEKVRAQALLDVVNEINYFTQQGDK